MTAFQIIAVLITLTALFSYFNHRHIRLPTTIGVMLMALVASLVLIGLAALGLPGIRFTRL
jgi:monovalent cation:H+ antiporter, CPA1 family